MHLAQFSHIRRRRMQVHDAAGLGDLAWHVVADELGLAEHDITVGDETVRLHFGADVEGHLGKDGRHYVLDTARTFPSECFKTTTAKLCKNDPKCKGSKAYKKVEKVLLQRVEDYKNLQKMQNSDRAKEGRRKTAAKKLALGVIASDKKRVESFKMLAKERDSFLKATKDAKLDTAIKVVLLMRNFIDAVQVRLALIFIFVT